MSELLTVSEVAHILRVDDTTVRRWVKQGALEAVILPHVNERQAYRIKRETLNRVLSSNVIVQTSLEEEEDNNTNRVPDHSAVLQTVQ
jgi:excisionase family DNA binding protein